MWDTDHEQPPAIAVEVENVRGMGARDAVYIIENRGAKVQIKGCGRVCQQSKAAGSVIKKGEVITLYLS